MKIRNDTRETTKAAALYMLKNGLASYKEIAELSGRSRQIIRIWGGKVHAMEARKRYLQRAWTRANDRTIGVRMPNPESSTTVATRDGAARPPKRYR